MLEFIADEPQPSFAVGDVPSSPLQLTLATTHPWTTVTTSAGIATIAAAVVTLTLPPLDTPGVLSIALTLEDAGGKREAVEPVRVVVEDPESQWLSIAQARGVWADAPESDVDLYELLDAARTACEEFVKDSDGLLPAVIPASFRRAQRLQAGAVWTASRATVDNRMGGEEFGVTVYPLDWNVKQLLRPKTGFPGMF